MKKLAAGVAVVFIVSLLTVTSDAATDDVIDGMVSKFRRGLIDIFTGWLELPCQIRKGYEEGFGGDEEQRIIGALVGIPEGAHHAVGRMLSGLSEVAGFWAADPPDNKDIGIPLDAELPWQETMPSRDRKPDIIEGAIAPMVTKLFRGAGNTLFGFMEVPNQINRGISEKSADFGCTKAIWFWLSREYNGVTDIVTTLVPNHDDTVGASLDDAWSWDSSARSR